MKSLMFYAKIAAGKTTGDCFSLRYQNMGGVFWLNNAHVTLLTMQLYDALNHLYSRNFISDNKQNIDMKATYCWIDTNILLYWLQHHKKCMT